MFRRLHGISRLALALWFSSLAIVLGEVRALIALLATCMIFLIGGLGFRYFRSVMTGVGRVLHLLAAVFVIQVFFSNRGNVLLNIGGIDIHTTGIEQGVVLSIRIMVIYLSAKLLGYMSYKDFDAAFRWIRMPEEMAFMVAYAVHLIPGLTRMFKAKRQILVQRGIDYPRLPYRTKLKLFGTMALAVTAGLLHDSDVRSMVLELRGFRSAGRSTRYQEIKPGFF